MAKLDKQGLNTFIRELDKHINTKINRLDISPKADKVLMSDGTNVETSILELKELVGRAKQTLIEECNKIISLKCDTGGE